MLLLEVHTLSRSMQSRRGRRVSQAIFYYLAPLLVFGAVLFADFVPSVFGSYADQRLLLALSMIVLIVLGILRVQSQQNIVSMLSEFWPFLPLSISFLLAAFQLAAGPYYLVEPVFYALYFLSFGVAGFVIRAQGRTREVAHGLVTVAGVSCFFYAAMSITVYLFAISDGFSSLHHVIPWGFVNIRYWSHIATWVVPLLPLCLLTVSWKDNRLWLLGVSSTGAIWWWILFLSSSRGSIISLFAGLILAWFFFGRAALPWLRLSVRFVVYGLIIWFLFSIVVPSLVFDEIQVRGIKGGSSGRIPLWLEAWQMSMQNFPFGMGSQSWLTHELLTESYRASPKFAHPHNMYLMWAAEYGWICIAAIVLLCSVALRALFSRVVDIREEKYSNALYLVAFTSSVSAAIIHAGVSAVFIAPGSMLVGLYVLSVFWALIKPGTKPNRPAVKVRSPSGSGYVGYMLALVVILAGALWFFEVLRYREAMEGDLTDYQDETSLGQLPRFWFHGNFPRHPSQMPDN